MEFAIGFFVGLAAGFVLVLAYETVRFDPPNGTRADG